jgi:Fic-DOC domain mobile mystery protein B
MNTSVPSHLISPLFRGENPRYSAPSPVGCFEEQNIAKGIAWLKNRQDKSTSYEFWLKLHKKLFEDVWKWAGAIRKHELNNPDFSLPNQIWPAFKLLKDDLEFWLKEHSFSMQEISARFHERIETIHPFTNGNGRFGRILIEHFCENNSIPSPSWGKSFKNTPKKRRKNYIAALDYARHKKDFKRLIEFMFS